MDSYIKKLEEENETLNAERVSHLLELSFFRSDHIVKELSVAEKAIDFLRKELVKLDKTNKYTEYIGQLGEVHQRIEALNILIYRNAKSQFKKEKSNG